MGRKAIVAGLAGLLLAGCAGMGQYTPTVGFRLPEKYNSPDGMTLGKDGCIYLALNNAGKEFKFEHPAKIIRITPDDRLEEVVDLPAHPETKVASPLGIGFASDGNLYVSDNQMFATEKLGKSRLLRVVMKDRKAVRVEVVATGLNMANGLACRGDAVYVCDTTLGSESPMPSGVYRFRIADLKAGKPVRVTGLKDPRLLVTLETRSTEHKVGANGLGFDSKGNLYVCNFGDREVIKVVFDAAGKVAGRSVLARGAGMLSTDGLQPDAEDNLWVADFLGNAVFKICSRTGKVTCIAKNGPTDGSDGGLDAPSECIRRGNRVYVSNIDITYGPNKHDAVHTISVIDLKD